MTAEQLHTAALTQFAALTRHKPESLADQFKTEISATTVKLRFGKRSHTADLPAGWQDADTLDLSGAVMALYKSV